MASDSFKTVIFGLVLFTLFSFLIIFTTIQMGNNYGKSVEEIGNGALTDSNYYNSIDDVASSSENFRARFDTGNVEDVDDVSGIFGIVTDIVSMITAPFSLLAQVLSNILHIPSIVISVILGLLGISIILGIWALLRKGD